MEKSKKQILNLLLTSNYLHSIYIVLTNSYILLGMISNLETVLQNFGRMCIGYTQILPYFI